MAKNGIDSKHLDEQRALDVFSEAEKQFYGSPEDVPRDATLLLAMANALLAKQLARFLRIIVEDSVEDTE